MYGYRALKDYSLAVNLTHFIFTVPDERFEFSANQSFDSPFLFKSARLRLILIDFDWFLSIGFFRLVSFDSSNLVPLLSRFLIRDNLLRERAPK